MAGGSDRERKAIGYHIHNLITNLYPICRSITGDGFRQSMRIIQEHIPIELREVPTGTQVFDWQVPKEWNIRDAYVKDSRGHKVIDFQQSNLHILNYSTPVHRKMDLAELKSHIFSLPESPQLIPYKTSYYAENWGFCISYADLQSLDEGEYDVYIDSSLEDGTLTYGEYFIEGQTDDEILISCHSCHPSLCNDNLSGMGVATYLAKALRGQSIRYSYRFIFIPGTIGSITWLAQNEARLNYIKHGLVIACVGDPGNSTYKRSRNGNAEIDRAAIKSLHDSGQDYEIIDFSPYGYDERQYCSPGINLPVGSLTRTPHGRFPEYHTSADNLEFVRPEYLEDSYHKYLAIFEILEHNIRYINTNPKCEPQLGRRGLYSAFGGKRDSNQYELAMLWVLNYSDGKHSLLDIAEKSGFQFKVVKDAAAALLENGLLKELRT